MIMFIESTLTHNANYDTNSNNDTNADTLKSEKQTTNSISFLN